MMSTKISETSVSALATTTTNAAKTSGTKDEDIVWIGNNHGEIIALDISSIDALNPNENEPPKVSFKWRAHRQAVTCLTLVEYQNMLISTSFDQTCRVWNMEGHCVGTFSQTTQWDLTRKETWLHPFTPDDVLTDVDQLSKSDETDIEDKNNPVDSANTNQHENEWLDDVKGNIEEAHGKRLTTERFLSAHPKFYKRDPASNAFRLV